MWFGFDTIRFKLEQIESDVRKLAELVEKDEEWKDRVDQHLFEYNAQLKIHIEGVKELKETNKLLQMHIDAETKRIQKDLDPIKKHINYVQITFKYIIVPLFLTVCGYAIKVLFE